MSTTMQAPSRSLLRALKSSSQRSNCQCSRARRFAQSRIQQQRWNSSASIQGQSDLAEQPISESTPQPQPRWAQTPPAMVAPVRTRPRKPNWKAFPVNDDPAKLDAMYTRFLGRTGPKMLSDETKWLAVTHKSFDHGRRGFNDRLSYLGRQIVELQTSLAMLTAADVTSQMNDMPDKYGRQPFRHPATENVEVLNNGGKEFFMHHKQMSGVAARYGLPDVVRWLPKDVDHLAASGCDMVYTQALFAIIGALAMEQGGLVANRVARERILQPMGLKSSLLEDTPKQEQLTS